MSDAEQTTKHARLKPLRGEMSEVLLPGSSIFHLPNVLGQAHTLLVDERTTVTGARQDGWPGKGCTARAGAEGARDLSETHPEQLHIPLRHF